MKQFLSFTFVLLIMLSISCVGQKPGDKARHHRTEKIPGGCGCAGAGK
ncbi:hypothetical protein BH09BAC5_BH09BAC5_16830 [soil metagenome]